MPYTADQCKKFAVMAARGERVPTDWREKCRGVKQGSGGKPKPKTRKR